MSKTVSLFACLFFFLLACDREDPDSVQQWGRYENNPVLRDSIPAENYEAASDAHVFYDGQGELKMIYTGDANGKASIKLAEGSGYQDWSIVGPLLPDVGPSGLDIQKETAFYRLSGDGKHQIYYIGYDDEDTYQSQIYLAKAESLIGPYTQSAQPIVSRGEIANRDVYCMTSPSVVEHEGLLYLTFIGWDASPSEVRRVWVMGATSNDEGRTWSDFERVKTPIGMEGQVTKVAEGEFVAVRTGEFAETMAIFRSTAEHPFGPWKEGEPILLVEDPVLEKDELIAPQITVDPATEREYLYYAGADYQIGWWIMLAEED